MKIISDHRSPNWNHRPEGAEIDTVVMHATASESCAQDVEWLCNRESKASAHVVIDRDGTVYDLVDVAHRAWHAGAAEFGGHTDVNSFSIGVELANRNDGEEPYTDTQYRVAALLVAGYMRRFPKITIDRVTTHAHIALPSGRKSDPAPPAWSHDRFLRLVQIALADAAAHPTLAPEAA